MAASSSGEYLIDNHIDPELLQILKPLNLFQSFFLVPRYRVRDNFVTPHSPKFKLLSYLVAISTFSLYCLSISQFVFNYIIIAINIICRVVCCIGHGILILLNGQQSDLNVMLLRKLQEVIKKLKCSEVYSGLARNNWLLLITNTLVSTAFLCYSVHTRVLLKNLYLGMILIFDVHMIYAVCILKIMVRVFARFIGNVEGFLQHRIDSKPKEIECNEILKSFRQILHIYDMYQKIFQAAILFSFIKVFLQCFLIVKIALYASGNTYSNMSALYFTIAVTLVSQLLNSYLCYLCAKFYTCMDYLRGICLCTQTVEHHTYEQRKLGKNILRVSRTFQKLSACGLFAVQPALLLRLCGVLLTLTLMLLQLVLL